MNRRELYALGEPLGECVTRPKLGGGYVCGGGGGGSSSSDSSTKTTTYNTDKRVVADGQSTVTSADIGSGSTVNVTTSDMNAIKGAGQVANQAIVSNASNVDHLLATADHLFQMQANSMQASVDLTKSLNGSVQQAYADASNQAAGNKNLILAGMAVVAVVAVKAFGK